jgi:cobalamin biosynthetic protein CobC
MALIHGGQLQQIANKYQIPADNWLDLSTGIAPFSYPIPAIPPALWRQLPQKNEALMQAAKKYYRCEQLLVTNGSQSIIKALPALWHAFNRQSTTVYLPQRGYKEHAHAWETAGYQLHFYQDNLPAIDLLDENSILVIINPNNPTGKVFSRETIMCYQKKIKKLNGLLVVDEAFIDVLNPEDSIASDVNDQHTLVLRSFGKFFGLAGIRIGFLVANSYWCEIFSEHMGPWQVNGPAQFIAEQALADEPWQQIQKRRLKECRQQQQYFLLEIFGPDIITNIGGSDLFLTMSFHQPHWAAKCYHLLCQQGLYVRLSDEQDTLRFGIATEQQSVKLFKICREIKEGILALTI